MLLDLLVSKFGKRGIDQPARGRASQQGSLIVAQAELELGMLAKAGRLFHGGLQLAANGIAPDATLPTTTAKLALYNSGARSRLIYVDFLHHFLLTGTAAAGSTLWIARSNGPLAAAISAHATGFGMAPVGGDGASECFWGVAVTLPVGSIWASYAGSFQPAAANFGQSDVPVSMRGGILLPPKYAMGIAILSGAGTTPLYGISARIAELDEDLD